MTCSFRRKRPGSEPLLEPLENRCFLSAQPDLQIKLKTESSYSGDHVYNATGAGQSRSAPVGGIFPMVYHVRIQNDGSATDSFTLQVTGARRNRWRVRTYDSQVTGYDGGVNISDATATGWKTGPIAGGASKDIRVEVLPLFATSGGQARTVVVTAISRTDGTRDTVTATTTYTPAPAVEIRRQNFDASGKYLYSVQNLGNVVDHVKVTGPAAGRSYTVRYFDAPVGGNDVTAAVTGGGWVSEALAPGAEAPLRVELSARAGADVSAQRGVDGQFRQDRFRNGDQSSQRGRAAGVFLDRRLVAAQEQF